MQYRRTAVRSELQLDLSALTTGVPEKKIPTVLKQQEMKDFTRKNDARNDS